MSNQKIAIVGGSGFVGHFFEKRINNKFEYKIFDKKEPHSNGKYVYFDLLKCDNADEFFDIDIIINLAAVHRDNVKPKSLYHDVNVKGSENICEIAKKNDIPRIIFLSSVAVYGFTSANTYEDGQKNFFNEYGKTKFLAERVYTDWQKEEPTKRSLSIIRPTVIFGEGNRGNVYNLMNQINSKRFIMIGDGKNKKSMAYVKNVAAFIEFSISLKNNLNIFNYSDKPDFDMNSLVSQIRSLLFKKNNVGIRLPKFLAIFLGYIADLFSILFKVTLPVSSIRIKKFIKTTQFSSSYKPDKFKAPFSLEEGLQNTVKYEFIDENDKNLSFETD